MTVAAYYNEHDPFAAAWLRELIADNLIAPGEVDERSIEDVTPDDLRSFRQCHFFAGIGIWSLAARRYGIPDDAPLWSGSCPCQPFSQAGKGGGFDDERHLWPAFHYLIEQCAPAIVVGEQVAGADGDAWLELVSADLDATGYAFGAAETCAAGFGAPHIRSRNYWVAYAENGDRRRGERGAETGTCSDSERWWGSSSRGRTDRLADAHARLAEQLARQGTGSAEASRGGAFDQPPRRSDADRLAEPGRVGWQRGQGAAERRLANGENARWVEGHDGSIGGDEAGAFGLADGERSRLEGQRGHGDDGDQSGRIGADAARPASAGREPCGLADDVDDGQRQHGGRVDRTSRADEGEGPQRQRIRADAPDGGAPIRMADGDREGRGRSEELHDRRQTDPSERGDDAGRRGAADRLGNAADESGRAVAELFGAARAEPTGRRRAHGLGHNRGPGPTNGVWGSADWLRCRDEKWRAVEPGTFPLVDAGTFRNRVGLLRGAGNAITLGQAEEFIRAVAESIR